MMRFISSSLSLFRSRIIPVSHSAFVLAGLWLPMIPLTAQTVISPSDEETVTIDEPNSPAVVGDEGVQGVTVTVTGAGAIDVTETPAIHGRGPAWTVTNSGILKSALAVNLENGGTLTNNGTIEGDVFLGGGSLRNARAINGDISFGDDDATLTLIPGHQISGDVDGGGGNNVLELGPTAGFFSPRSAEYDGSFTGFSKLQVDAAGTIWTLSGDQEFSAGIDIVAGVLRSMDLLTSDTSDIRVLSNDDGEGTLVSAGAVNGNIDVGGSLVVGDVDNSLNLILPEGDGILSVSGDVTFQNGSQFVVIGGNTSMEATGAVVLGFEDAGEDALPRPTLFIDDIDVAWGDQNDILTADLGLTGEFSDVTTRGFRPFLRPEVNYDGTSATATWRTDRETLGAAGQTANQRSMARALANLEPVPGSQLEAGFRDFVSEAGPQSFGALADTMSGEIIASGAMASSVFSRSFRDTVLNTIQYRPAQTDGRFALAPGAAASWEEHDSDRGFWLRGQGVFGNLDRPHNTGDADYRLGGILLGLDTVFTDSGRIGVAAGYGRSRVSRGGDHVDGDIYQTALYASRRADRFVFDGMLGYGFHDLESHRVVQPANERVNANYNGHEVFGSVQTTYLHQDEGILVLPFGGVDFSYFQQGSFRESGTWGLDGNSASVESLRAFLGVRMVVEHITARNGLVLPEARIRYNHQLLDRDASFSGRFREDPDSNRFTTTGASTGRGEVQLGLGVMVQPGRWRSLSFFADFDISVQLQQHFSTGVRITF